ncbi:hypothetical protein GOODEAATRI_015119 [Goodea atripinnis]|uniref:Uncharacterized protein n=1 Tax=Goodea atripinnis TaxID=208336 RepID=A0ABV0MTM4_9TELE
MNHHHKTFLSSPPSVHTVSSSPMVSNTSSAYCLYTSTSTHSLMDPASETPSEVLSHNPTQQTSIFQIHDSRSSLPPSSSSQPALPSQPSVSSLDSGSPQLNVLAPCLTLANTSASEHTSLECLLGNRDCVESRDSESVSSRRSSIGGQTQSTEQSWCLDLTD